MNCTKSGFRQLYTLVFFILLIGIAGCTSGLNPDITTSVPVLQGTIYYTGGAATFPPRDSVYFLTVVAFRNIPRDSSVLNAVLNGDAYFLSTTLPYGVDSTTYRLELNFPANRSVDTLRYIAVAQQYGPNINSDWRVVGVYRDTEIHVDSIDRATKTLIVVRGQQPIVPITVDFKKLPEAPF